MSNELELSVDATDVRPGDTITATVTLSGSDEKARGLRVALVRSNKAGLVGAVRPVQAEVAGVDLDPTAAGAQTAMLVVPEHTTPSVAGEVEWNLVASLDRKGARDAHQSVALTIASNTDVESMYIEPQTVASGDAAITINIDQTSVQVGDKVAGTVDITPREDLTPREVRVRMFGRQVEPLGPDQSHTGEPCVIDVGTIAANTPITLDFVIEVPADARPSFTTPDCTLRWYVEAVIDLKLAADPTARREIAVVTG
ncbi:MAG: hypothetical protein ACT4PP_16625 [Sporichthyaceae bacterium]